MMSEPNGDPDSSINDGAINDDDEFVEEEYAAINSMLDQISSYLDNLEERNEALNDKLKELMESNRQARLEFRAQLLCCQVQKGQQSTDGCYSSNEEPSEDDEGSQMN